MTHDQKRWLKIFGTTGLVATFIMVMVACGYANSLANMYIRSQVKKEFVSIECYERDKVATEEVNKEISKDLKSILKNLRSINATFASAKIKMINVEVE